MIAFAAAIGICLVIGLPLSALLDGGRDSTGRAGRAFLLGAGLASLAMLGFEIAGIRWSRTGLLAAASAIAVILWSLLLRRSAKPTSDTESQFAFSSSWAARLADLLVVVMVAGYAAHATTAFVFDLDYFHVWGLKGRAFFRLGAIDWDLLTNRWSAITVPDYPVLLPLLLSFQATLAGSWNEVWIGAFWPVFGLATILVVRGALRGERFNDTFVSVGTLAVTGVALSPWIGLGDGPLVAFATAGLLCVRRALTEPEGRWLTLGAILLGFAAATKNEGMALLLAVAVSLLLCGGGLRRALALWPAIPIVAPWLILRSVHGVESSVFIGSTFFERLRTNLGHLGGFAEGFARVQWQPLLWTGILLAWLISYRVIVRSERFMVLAIVTQSAVAATVYLATPLDPALHLEFSIDRVLSQVTILMLLVGLFGMGRTFQERVQNNGHAKRTAAVVESQETQEKSGSREDATES